MRQLLFTLTALGLLLAQRNSRTEIELMQLAA